MKAACFLGLVAAALALGDAMAGEAGWAERALARATEPQLGLPLMPHPTDNPPSVQKIGLGRKLFFDRRLSANGTMSCAMCHVPEQGFVNHELATAVGVEGRSVRRNAPTVLNVGFYKHLFVDGRETALETQYIAPLTAFNEMANPSVGHVVALLTELPDYAGLFEAAFGAGPSADRIGHALGAYQRSLAAGDSRFDQWRYGGDPKALSAAEKKGFELFSGRAGCTACHLIEADHALFTDQGFHDIGYGWWREQLRQHPPAEEAVEVAPGVVYPVARATVASVGDPRPPDLGRYEVTKDPADLWKFRTPSLRNVAVTPPYMHDGGLATLEDVLRFYNGGGRPHPGQDPLIRPLGLSNLDMEDLIAFLGTLTSERLGEMIEEARSAAPDNL